ncbi:MAG TPA: alkaline phosphatase family protein [Casimicrobiaceae bacterium]|jgi:phospholipase C
MADDAFGRDEGAFAPHDADSAISSTRREFLTASAAATAALLTGCLSEGSSDPRPSLGADDPLSKFDHLVVVMFENRSFDCVLGYAYQPGEPPRNQTYDGLAGKEFRNPVPAYINDGNDFVATRMSPGTDADMQNPNPDPGEEYEHVNTALFSVVNPLENQFLDASDMLPPYNNPAPGQVPTMDGFVWDYCNNFVHLNERNPTFDEYRVIMDGFTPEQLPVINRLAKSFAVYDAWFCAVPTQTIPNRSFFHASSSTGFVVNEPYRQWLFNDVPTIFNRLYDAGIGWRIYYDESQVVPLTALLHGVRLEPFFDRNFYTMTEFYRDVADGTLPAYAFVEPRMLYNNNDYHPPAPLSKTVNIGGWSDVRTADQLVHDIYMAVKTSASRTGSNAKNTLLLLTFDEHGNCFDHVVPPAAVPPYDPVLPGELGFRFDRLGVRVPAIAISAYTQENTIVNRQIHHGALVRTLCEKYDLDYLTERDRTAPDLSDALNLSEPRDPSTWPTPIPRAPALHPPGRIEDRPPNDLEKAIVGLAIARFSEQPTATPMPQTVGEAQSLLRTLVGDRFKHA